jgi:antitoxin protein of toxin-antitoxin system
MPKIKNLAALAAAVEAARRYARSNPDKAAQYLDQAAAFLDKQTKGKYSGQVSGVVGKVKSAAGLPQNSGTRGYETNAGYGAHAGYGGSAVAPDPLTTTAPSTTPPPVNTPPTRSTVDPDRTGDRPFPGSKDL